MIGRRIRKHVRQQNWFAVSIDLLIVVVGVFIGIEVSNWNEARQVRAEERRYYSQVRADLVSDVQTFQFAQQRSRLNDAQAQLALSALEGSVTDHSPADVAMALHRGAFLYLPVANRTTFDELISTGNLSLLRDHALKRRISEYYSSFEQSRQWDVLLRSYQSNYWTAAAGVLPSKVLQASIRNWPLKLSRPELDEILSEARSRATLRDLLTGMAAHQERVRRDSEAAQRRARKLIASIDERLI